MLRAGFLNPTPLEGEIRFVQVQDQQVVTNWRELGTHGSSFALFVEVVVEAECIVSKFDLIASKINLFDNIFFISSGCFSSQYCTASNPNSCGLLRL